MLLGTNLEGGDPGKRFGESRRLREIEAHARNPAVVRGHWRRGVAVRERRDEENQAVGRNAKLRRWFLRVGTVT